MDGVSQRAESTWWDSPVRFAAQDVVVRVNAAAREHGLTDDTSDFTTAKKIGRNLSTQRMRIRRMGGDSGPASGRSPAVPPPNSSAPTRRLGPPGRSRPGRANRRGTGARRRRHLKSYCPNRPLLSNRPTVPPPNPRDVPSPESAARQAALAV